MGGGGGSFCENDTFELTGKTKVKGEFQDNPKMVEFAKDVLGYTIDRIDGANFEAPVDCDVSVVIIVKPKKTIAGAIDINELAKIQDRDVKVKVVEGGELWEELTDEGGWTEDQIRNAVYYVSTVTPHHDEIEATCPELCTGMGLDGWAIGKSADFVIVE